MEIGLFAALSSFLPGPEFIPVLGREAEDRGIESVWLGEHVVLFDDYDSPYPYAADGKIPMPPGTGMLEPFVTLAYLAASTERLRLGTGICLVPQRNPVYTAKQVADLDWLSGGRFDFGIGIGWLEEEFEALHVPWEGRGARTDEYLQVMRSLWTEDLSSHDGDLYPLPESRMFPKPLQQPHPPIHVGGESDAALRRAARFGQGWFGFNRAPEDVPERVQALEKALAEEGRSRDGFQVSICSYFHGLTPDMVEGYRKAGVDRVIALFFAPSVEDIAPTLDGLVPCIEAARV